MFYSTTPIPRTVSVTILSLMLLSPASVARAQSSTQDRAKAAYFLAVEAHQSGKPYEVLGRLDEVVTMLGSSNARIETLRAREYYVGDLHQGHPRAGSGSISSASEIPR